ncbi:NUDIX domain-containing protein [Sphingomonas sp. PR090111-T3T-6A]|uniref:NUDIX domain-containing protein n=1 Tax=Sphingomonas sp. PR090111-T3T-6A TaxID=685778 RepID=UPI00037F42A2|nr:NUDIX domain-containing protein [Sphingomonas sp. PR090111-T3T-6A]
MQTEPRVGCGVAIIVGGRILLLKRATEPESGCWGLPGGKVDLYETAAVAARREVEEELGIVVETGELLCFVDQIDRAGGTHWVAAVYLAEAYAGTSRILEPEKHAGLDWFALDALPAPLTTSTVAAMAAWQA